MDKETIMQALDAAEYPGREVMDLLYEISQLDKAEILKLWQAYAFGEIIGKQKERERRNGNTS